jgi:abortive infection bacteriophage resistance protein
MNRMYYACFYAVSALLVNEGIDAKSQALPDQFGSPLESGKTLFPRIFLQVQILTVSLCQRAHPASRKNSALRVGVLLLFAMSKSIYTKVFISCLEQIALLKSRGMKFADENKARHLLENISYYRFSGYWYPLLADKQNHVFKPGACFETAFSLYKFDRELRQILGSEIEKIEVAVRAKMAYVMSLTYNAFWMEDTALFSNLSVHQLTLNKIQDELDRSDEEFILSFKSKYSNRFPPSFILLEITSFGALSRLYSNLKQGKPRKDIAGAFGLPDRVLESWLHSLVYIRNMCAHHARLWNRQIGIKPLFPRHTKDMWIDTNGLSNRRMYYIFSIVLYLLNAVNPNNTFKQKLENLFLKYPNVDRKAMGFPANWRDEPLWTETL